MAPGNATGWNELINGQIFLASYAMWDLALAHWTVAILFILYEFMLLIKTKSLTLAWVSGLFFTSMFAASTFVDKTTSLEIMFVLLAFELAGILYLTWWKEI